MSTDHARADSIATVAEKAPVTAERRVRTDLDDRLPKPCSYTLSLFSSWSFSNSFCICFQI